VVRVEVFLKGYLKAHAIWASDKAKHGYIKDNTQSQMTVSLNLGIYISLISKLLRVNNLNPSLVSYMFACQDRRQSTIINCFMIQCHCSDGNPDLIDEILSCVVLYYLIFSFPDRGLSV
jgi:hypothetical protein